MPYANLEKIRQITQLQQPKCTVSLSNRPLTKKQWIVFAVLLKDQQILWLQRWQNIYSQPRVRIISHSHCLRGQIITMLSNGNFPYRNHLSSDLLIVIICRMAALFHLAVLGFFFSFKIYNSKENFNICKKVSHKICHLHIQKKILLIPTHSFFLFYQWNYSEFNLALHNSSFNLCLQLCSFCIFFILGHYEGTLSPCFGRKKCISQQCFISYSYSMATVDAYTCWLYSIWHNLSSHSMLRPGTVAHPLPRLIPNLCFKE